MTAQRPASPPQKERPRQHHQKTPENQKPTPRPRTTPHEMLPQKSQTQTHLLPLKRK